MKYLLGIDTETTGLNTNSDDVIEVGAVLYDIENNKPVQILSKLVKTDKKISKKITDITGITQEDVEMFGTEKDIVFSELTEMAKHAVACVAHNAPFDRGMLKGNGWETDLPWIDTVKDIQYPAKVKYRELTYIAAHSGFINPFSHRAAADVLTMFKAIEPYDLTSVIEKLTLPVRTLEAKVSYERRQLAKDAGFSWNGDKKKWSKTGRFTDRDIESLKFSVKVIEGE